MKHIALVMFMIAVGTIFALSPASDQKDEFVVHEWGTFTSVQDSQGVVLEWRSINDWDLPNFVYNGKTNPSSDKLDTRRIVTNEDSKKLEETVQRMETPVIFFYGKTGQQVDVNVKFPLGAFTEWYPRVRDVSRSSDKLENGYLRWGKVTLLDPKDKEVKLPDEKDYKGHYLASRDTDANVVRLCAQKNNKNDKDKTEYEKFLFYRGIGNFDSPLRVATQYIKCGQVHVEISNSSDFSVTGIYVIRVEDGKAVIKDNRKAGILSKTSWKVSIAGPSKSIEEEISSSKFLTNLEADLVRTGLYKKEAKAFVETWKESYFNSDGLRILYILPQKYTDDILPLSINPAPDKLVRVMVGRVECITNKMADKVTNLIKHLGYDSSSKRAAAKEAILKLGRFAEAALKVAIKETKDAEIKTAAQEILKEISSIH